MKACFYLIFFGESVQKIIFKESFYLLRPNMHYKIYGKKFETNVSNAHFKGKLFDTVTRNYLGSAIRHLKYKKPAIACRLL